MPDAVSLADIEKAALTIAGSVVETPATRSRTLSEITGAEVFAKFENLQFTGSFKERGAANFLSQLDADARARGVVAASAGNHAQGVAYHAHRLGIAATIVMPVDTPFSKVANTAHHDARIVLHGDDFGAALAEARRISADTGATLVPAFDDARVIAGQGTVGLELLSQVSDLDAVLVPVGGGGLIAGVATAVKTMRPGVEVIGVQSEGYAGMAHALGRAAAPAGGTTVAEGIAVAEPGALPVAISRALVDDFVIVSEQRIEEAIALGIEIEKTVLEGAGAAALAALLDQPARFTGRRIALIFSGGNIDTRMLSSVLLRALARSGRLVRLHIEVPDRPGTLARVAQVVGAQHGNIVDVAHHRDLPGVAITRTLLDLSIETRDRTHADTIVSALRADGFAVEVV